MSESHGGAAWDFIQQHPAPPTAPGLGAAAVRDQHATSNIVQIEDLNLKNSPGLTFFTVKMIKMKLIKTKKVM